MLFVSGELLGSGLHICEFLCERHFGFTHKCLLGIVAAHVQKLLLIWLMHWFAVKE